MHWGFGFHSLPWIGLPVDLWLAFAQINFKWGHLVTIALMEDHSRGKEKRILLGVAWKPCGRSLVQIWFFHFGRDLDQKGEEDGLSGECEHDPAMPHFLSTSHNPLQHTICLFLTAFHNLLQHSRSENTTQPSITILANRQQHIYQKINFSDQHEKNLFFNRTRFQMSDFSSWKPPLSILSLIMLIGWCLVTE